MTGLLLMGAIDVDEEKEGDRRDTPRKETANAAGDLWGCLLFVFFAAGRPLWYSVGLCLFLLEGQPVSGP